jgi:hypothetical protein
MGWLVSLPNDRYIRSTNDVHIGWIETDASQPHRVVCCLLGRGLDSAGMEDWIQLAWRSVGSVQSSVKASWE